MNRKQFNRVIDLCLTLRGVLRDVEMDGLHFDSLNSIAMDAFVRLDSPKPKAVKRIYLTGRNWNGPVCDITEHNFLATDKKLDACKCYKNRVGCSLMDAKYAVEAYGEWMKIYAPGYCAATWEIK